MSSELALFCDFCKPRQNLIRDSRYKGGLGCPHCGRDYGLDEVKFECLKNCGKCCGPVPMTPAFISLHKDKIQNIDYTLSPAKFMKIRGGREVWALTKDLHCIFLTKDKQCSIYDHRPDVCRKYGRVSNLQCPFLDFDGKRRDKPLEGEKFPDE